jgi:signal-transduction protein with cAMP-binding, CBS, and nucleotidyltransferase domain
MDHLKTTLKEIMTRLPVSVSANDSLLELKHIYERQKFHHHILVKESDQVIGIISLVDFMHAIGSASLSDDDPHYKKKVRDIMSSPVTMLDGNTEIHQALTLFLRNEIHAIPVTENGIVNGIVTSTDLLRFLAEKSA